ncbi:HD-domain/PDEase-like protein [Macroventuria anomochaeta]|uniref:HD-domain/PDEase-like protein n=1 Tax=Macroventuria anomochaeta TaxID=301207 RepID=A0ACB6RVV4_9PLEO|nr:HD-domain/PDEase-like protein [Macroventuria anomochaeta]KAF2625832.1 HD-domain/PDEase-like protein [Macroventuria anomochaeta]
MEHGACNVIYVDRRANDEHVKRETLSSSLIARTSTGNVGQSYFALGKTPPVEVHANVEAILSIFNEVHICGSGSSCLSKIAQLVDATKSNIPTFVILDVPYDEELRLKRLSREPRTPSPTSPRITRVDNGEPDDTYSTHLLTHISSEISSRNFSKLVVPVVMLTGLERESASAATPPLSLNKTQVLTDTVRLSKYLDSGAVDVLSSPLSKDRMHGLAVHAYRLQKEATREDASFLTTKRNRKLSWVGVDDAKPYAYLREAMVSSLMTGICNPETVGDSLDASDFELEPERKRVVEDKVATWAFSAHNFTDDELLYAALVMLEHALSSPELSQWQMTEDELIVFLMASRTAYNEFVKYHNFRHVVDVLQALFHFLVRIGTLPSYPPTNEEPSNKKSPIADLLKPFDALTLLISAIGHDVGHPGVNNAFLVALNAPLAQLYNDRSVLESFHCAAYSQILRRYWPKVFSDIAMRKLMINNILATDMGLHFKYMSDLGSLQEKIAHDKGVIDGWSVKVREEHKDLTCGLLIKCADICNVARKFETAAKWANILTDEFSNQGLMEEELQMPSCLFGGPPVRDDMIKLGESQIGFMNIFARPLFEAVTDILPAMRFAVDEILTNKSIWDTKIDQEKQRRKSKTPIHLGLLQASFARDPTPSPFSGGPGKPNATVPAPPTVQDEAGRRGSSGSMQGGIHGSRRSSAAVALASRENQSSSRRGSGDANLTAILVTHTPNAGDDTPRGSDAGTEDRSKADRKDTLTRSPSKKDRDNGRPVTAPAPARRSQVVELYPVQQSSSQSHSEIDLLQGTNSNLEGSKLQHWDSNKMSGESGATQSDLSRDSSWWRQMSSKRRTTRDARNGDHDVPYPPKESMLNPPTSHPDSNAHSQTGLSPGRKNTTGRFKSFFKRKPKGQEEQGKQLSSFGSSSQLRTTPPTSDQGRSFNSDD